MIKFDAATHTYTVNGVVVPNVTRILSPLNQYGGVPEHVLQAASERGVYVHKMCEMHVWDTLDEEGIEPEHVGYLDAFKLFLLETKFQVELTEEQLYHPTMMYAGTADLIGNFAHSRHKALVDIKTALRLMLSVGPQTAAYSEAWNETHDKQDHVRERYALQLAADGKYKLQPLSNPQDMNIFRSCLAIHNYMRKIA